MLTYLKIWGKDWLLIHNTLPKSKKQESDETIISALNNIRIWGFRENKNTFKKLQFSFNGSRAFLQLFAFYLNKIKIKVAHILTMENATAQLEKQVTEETNDYGC